jgi:hypothetical protein
MRFSRFGRNPPGTRRGAASPPGSPYTTGKTIGAHEVFQEIGRGADGVVYLAEHRDLKRRTAISSRRWCSPPTATSPAR